MPFAGGEDAVATNKMHETLKLLHETIQKQTKATEEQSKIMISLTRRLLYFTIALFVVSLFQIIIFIQNLYTTPRNIQTQTHYQQMSGEKKLVIDVQPLPKILKEKE